MLSFPCKCVWLRSQAGILRGPGPQEGAWSWKASVLEADEGATCTRQARITSQMMSAARRRRSSGGRLASASGRLKPADAPPRFASTTGPGNMPFMEGRPHRCAHGFASRQSSTADAWVKLRQASTKTRSPSLKEARLVHLTRGLVRRASDRHSRAPPL